MALMGYLAELRDGLALARALGRILVLPSMLCYCDRLWAGSDNILAAGCMYPGSEGAPFLPFKCPMDHVLSPAAWQRANLDFRDSSFLTRPQLQPALANSTVDVSLVPPVDSKLGQSLPATTPSTAMLPMHTTTDEAVRLLGSGAAGSATLLRIPHARGILCGLGSASEVAEFHRIARVLTTPAWCTRCHGGCQRLLARWFKPDELPGAGRGTTEWCMQPPRPPAFSFGKCVLNTVPSS
uniref:Uncharacterized protein n=1 Tax=Haptolina ericina TaxID=156174 RepID=A0A7S3BAD7_9EUKA